jgi:hypothetical protein
MTTHYNAGLATCNSVLLVTLGLIAMGACSNGKPSGQSSAGSVDTALLALGTSTPAAGPGVHVTAGDTKSVRQAGEYELTPENFSKFLRAVDTLQSLQARDSAARALLLVRDTVDLPTTEEDAGVKRLESNPAVNNAITSAGLSVRDYFVMAIAIASAERFAANPAAAPPTPTLQKNAEFVRGKTAELANLRAIRRGTGAVRVTP